MKKQQFIVDFICAMILLLLLYAAVSKITDYEKFESTLRMSPLLENHSKFVAIVLPGTEMAIAVLLFIPRFRLTGLYASFTLLSTFTIYLIYMIVFSPHLPCSCGGLFEEMSWKQHIFFNVFFIALSSWGIYLYRKRNVERTASPP